MALGPLWCGTAASCAPGRRPRPSGEPAMLWRSSPQLPIFNRTILRGGCADRLKGEPRDILAAGHFSHLPRLRSILLTGNDSGSASFPLHGVVALETQDEGETWKELLDDRRRVESISAPRW